MTAFGSRFPSDCRHQWFNERTEPAQLGGEVIASGARGILFGSALSATGSNPMPYVDEFGLDGHAVIDQVGNMQKDSHSGAVGTDWMPQRY